MLAIAAYFPEMTGAKMAKRPCKRSASKLLQQASTCAPLFVYIWYHVSVFALPPPPVKLTLTDSNANSPKCQCSSAVVVHIERNIGKTHLIWRWCRDCLDCMFGISPLCVLLLYCNWQFLPSNWDYGGGGLQKGGLNKLGDY